MLSALLAQGVLAEDVRVTLKGEDKDTRVTLVQLEGREVTYRKGRREHTVNIDDFIPESAFLVKSTFASNDPESRMDLARFAMHRGLFEEGRKVAQRVAQEHEDYHDRAARLAETARILQADKALAEAEEALDARDTEKAEPLLKGVIEDFPDTPAGAKAEVLLGTLRRVELEKRALELEKEAREAQQEADEQEQRRRAPIDDWLSELSAQVAEQEELKREADEDCASGRTFRGLPKYQDAVEALKTVRKALEENRDLLTFRGQDERADGIDENARQLMIECYYNWGRYLFQTGAYRTAATVCERGLAMDPKDRRLLSLKVDIDEWYDPTAD